MYERPLSHADILAIADHLNGTGELLGIAMSELGFNPRLYGDAEVEKWLEEEAGLVQDSDSGIWFFE
jgi:hypothetical protein